MILGASSVMKAPRDAKDFSNGGFNFWVWGVFVPYQKCGGRSTGDLALLPLGGGRAGALRIERPLWLGGKHFYLLSRLKVPNLPFIAWKLEGEKHSGIPGAGSLI